MSSPQGSSRPGNGWYWSGTLNSWYSIDASTGAYVLPNGQRLQVTSSSLPTTTVQRHPEPNAQSPAPSSSSPRSYNVAISRSPPLNEPASPSQGPVWASNAPSPRPAPTRPAMPIIGIPPSPPRYTHSVNTQSYAPVPKPYETIYSGAWTATGHQTRQSDMSASPTATPSSGTQDQRVQLETWMCGQLLKGNHSGPDALRFAKACSRLAYVDGWSLPKAIEITKLVASGWTERQAIDKVNETVQ